MFRLKTAYCNEAGDGNGSSGVEGDWKAALPESVRSWQEAETAKTPDDFFNQMDHYRSSYGRSIRVPGEDAGPEDRAKFLERLRKDAPELVPAPNPEDPDAMQSLYQTLGVPEEATGYKPPQVATERADMVDPVALEDFRGLAKHLNLTQAQFDGVVGGFLQGQFDTYDAQMADIEKQHVDLKTELGNTYEPKMKAAEQILKQHGFPEEVISTFAGKHMGATSTKAFISLAEAVGGEGVQMAAQESGSQPMLTPEEAREQAREIRRNKAGPYWNPADPGHMAARRKVRELTVMAQGGHNKEIDLAPTTMGKGGVINYGS